MKLSKWFVIPVAAAVAVGGAFVLKAKAAEAQEGRHASRGQLLERAKEKLGLTDDQIAKIKTEVAGEKDTIKDLITKWHDARLGLRQAIQAPDASEASVRAASAKVAAAEADLAVERFKLYGKITPLLTEDQRAKVKQLQGKIDDFMDNAISRLGDRLGTQ